LGFFLRILICIVIFGLAQFAYVARHNALTEKRLLIPILEQKLQKIIEENERLSFEKESFENPIHLLELLQRPQYKHLKHPQLNDIIIIKENKNETALAR
jgi:hypothetical protein